MIMKIAISMVALAAAACGSSYAPPAERLASSEAALRSARELGAQEDPQAALHVKLADDQLATGRHLMRDGENRRAALVLERAKSDAELAIALTREKQAKAAADEARKAIPQQPQPPTQQPLQAPKGE
jgi:hypothetical protein